MQVTGKDVPINIELSGETKPILFNATKHGDNNRTFRGILMPVRP